MPVTATKPTHRSARIPPQHEEELEFELEEPEDSEEPEEKETEEEESNDEDEQEPYEAETVGRTTTPPSFPKTSVALGTEISDCEREIGKCNRRALRFALRAGELLIEAKRRVGHGEWLSWLAKYTDLEGRRAQRYMQLARDGSRLDAIEPNWRSSLSITEALDLLASLKEVTGAGNVWGDEEEVDGVEWQEGAESCEEPSADEPADQSERDGACPDAETPNSREAKALHRKCVRLLPEFLETHPWRFRPGSDERVALEQVGAAVVRLLVTQCGPCIVPPQMARTRWTCWR
jgi:hypothetical protein